LPLAVETLALTKRYPRQRGLGDVLLGRPAGEKLALNGISLTIEHGEIFGLLGPNGSGKTTLLKLLSTILSPSAGTARVFGTDVTRDPRRVRELVALVTGEERSLYWRLTGRQNLEFFGRLYGLDGATLRKRSDELLDVFDLGDAGDARVAGYSTGMRQKLAIARGLMSSPRLLFLDEPTRGLDPVAAHALLRLVRERAVERFDNTVILTTHIAREVEQLCEHIAMLDHGTLVYEGTVDDLRRSLERGQAFELSVTGMSDDTFAALQNRLGPTHCQKLGTQDGVVEIAISFTGVSLTLSDVLRQLLFSGANVVQCTQREQSFEDMFRTVFEGRRDAALRAAQPRALRP
jgi:ABC-2 type transport system ATP-binding protein